MPRVRQKVMNSSKPKSLCSMPFQAGFFRGGRRSRSPMPSCQSIAADEIAARPAIDRRVEFLEQGQRIGAHAVDVVGRHERDGADPQRSLPGGDDFQPALVRIGGGREMPGASWRTAGQACR